jgi:type III restriction enzyme
VPFRFIPTVAQTRDVEVKPTRHVHAEPDRADCVITFPLLTGYRIELPDREIFADFADDAPFVVSTADFPTETVVAGLIGTEEKLTLDDLRRTRDQTVAFDLTSLLLRQYYRTDEVTDPRPWLFPQMLRLVKHWLATKVDYHDDTFVGLLRISQVAHRAAEKIVRSVSAQQGDRIATVLPVLRAFDPVGSTASVDFFTVKHVYGTAADRSHVNFVTLDGKDGNSWEQCLAKVLDELPGVAAYVKNDHLGFTIPYTHEGMTRQYVPDFLVRLADSEDVVRTLIVEVSGSQKSPGPTQAKAETARDHWVPAVNGHGGFGLWGYCQLGPSEITKAKQVITAAMDVVRGLEPLARRPRGVA